MSVRAILIFIVWAAIGYIGIRGLNYVYEASRLMAEPVQSASESSAANSAISASPVTLPPSHK